VTGAEIFSTINPEGDMIKIFGPTQLRVWDFGTLVFIWSFRESQSPWNEIIIHGATVNIVVTLELLHPRHNSTGIF